MFFLGGLAQLGERRLCTAKVSGSIPLASRFQTCAGECQGNPLTNEALLTRMSFPAGPQWPRESQILNKFEAGASAPSGALRPGESGRTAHSGRRRYLSQRNTGGVRGVAVRPPANPTSLRDP